MKHLLGRVGITVAPDELGHRDRNAIDDVLRALRKELLRVLRAVHQDEAEVPGAAVVSVVGHEDARDVGDLGEVLRQDVRGAEAELVDVASDDQARWILRAQLRKVSPQRLATTRWYVSTPHP